MKNPLMKFVRRMCLSVAVAVAVSCLALNARAYTHPCVPTTRAELDYIKARTNQEPFKTGYAMLSGDGKSKLTYVMNGPFAQVGRTPDVNLWPWRNDMQAAYNLARMWYFTGDSAYAQKARDILIAWANTHTAFTGQEISLSLGDYAHVYGGAVSILRGTWPGWTAADTTTIKNYLLNVYWPASLAGINYVGPANKGSLNMKSGIAIAVCLDDTAKFNHVINNYRTIPSSGLLNTLPTGEMGETGRDAGHGQGDLYGKAFVAEVAWKQGIDLFSELDNRLLAVGEYYARNTLTSDTPFVPFGTIDYNYYDNADGPYVADRSMLYILQNAYKNRKGLATPWIDRKLEEQPFNGENMMYAAVVPSTATPPAAAVRPAVSLASSGLTLTTLGTQTAGRSLSYANNVWTMTGLGNNVWTGVGGADDCQFAYRTMTGDCAIVAKVTSFTFSGNNNGKCGLMIRDNLSATVSQRAWVGILPASQNYMESRNDGWTETWGGNNWARRTQPLPPGMPYWLKIERRGNMINSYTSQDGTSWAAQISSYFGNLPSTVYIGLFVCSGTATAQTATFANVAFTGGSGGLVTTPAAPAALIATASGTAVTVRWLPSFGATSYDLLRSTTAGSGYTVLAANLTGTSYVDTSATAGVNYYYRARAKNSAGTSGDSMTFGGSHNLIKPATYLSVGGTATAFSYASAVEVPDKAFDRNPGSKWFASTAPTGWIQYDFGAGNAKVVNRYTLNSADVPARNPKNWTFLGSQDGSSWTTLDSQANQSFVIVMQRKDYDISNTTAYRYYRLNVTANNGDTTLAVAELGLWSTTGGGGGFPAAGTYEVQCRTSGIMLDSYGRTTAGSSCAIYLTDSGHVNQKWNLTYVSSDVVNLQAVGGGLYLDGGGFTANGSSCKLWGASTSNNLRWRLIPTDSGYFKLKNVATGMCVDVGASPYANGDNCEQWSEGGAYNQQWRFVGDVSGIVRLQSHNFPTRYLRHAAYRARIDENVSPAEDSQFRAVAGLADPAGVSFESVNFPGYYLRVRSNGEVWLDQNDNSTAFRNEATFRRVAGLADSGKSSFQMWTDSSRYLRHYAYLMHAQSGSGSAFNADATFAEVGP